MRRPIRIQILIPFSLTLLAAVSTIAVSAAWLAARRTEQQSLQHLNGILETLASSKLTYTKSILEKIRGLSGVELIALNSAGDPVSTTLPASALPDPATTLPAVAATAPLISAGQSFSEFPRVTAGPHRFFAARLRADGAARVATLIVLYPEARLHEERLAAAWPPLVVGAVTLSIVFLISAWLAGRIGKRIRDVQELLAQIAAGQRDSVRAAQHSEGESKPHPEIEPGPPSGIEHPDKSRVTKSVPYDELDALTQSAGSLLIQLSELQRQIRHTEQIRLLAQLAGGLAHQLRNAVTGARLAVQLHQRRCAISDDESLSVALQQLTLTEQQVRGLLTLGRNESQPAEPGRVSELIAELEPLVKPHAAHAHVELRISSSGSGIEDGTGSPGRVPDAESFRLAVLNLTLNAVEAAGGGGTVSVHSMCQDGTVQVDVEDSGKGPPDDIGATLFDPFVTSKPEGVGLGLALVRQAVHQSGGTIGWSRQNHRTVFRFSMPLTTETLTEPAASSQTSQRRTTRSPLPAEIPGEPASSSRSRS